MKKTIRDIDVSGKRVFVRVDYNVPMNAELKIVDDTRITATLPTINYLIEHNAKVILCSHLGRPNGQIDPKLSLRPVLARLSKLLDRPVSFAEDILDKSTIEMVNKMNDGDVLMLENIRFYKEEEENSPVFSAKLAELADIFVNDAFGTAHRKHSSTYGVAKLLPNAVGFLMGKEINTIASVLENPQRPFIAILGGAKISDKLKVVKNLLETCDTVLIGGGMAYTFLKAQGVEIGNSLYEEECLNDAKEILQKAKEKNKRLLLPQDHVCAAVFSPNAVAFKVKTQYIPTGMIGMDIGARTIKQYVNEIKNAKTIIWNGPMGVFEFLNFREGTKKIAKAVAKSSAKSIVGGGDSLSAIKSLKLEKKIYHLSTGGGASLKLISGEVLPGVDVIADK